jgi:hypothetical protein
MTDVTDIGWFVVGTNLKCNMRGLIIGIKRTHGQESATF